MVSCLYFDTEKMRFDVDKPQECHRQIADYYESLIPPNKAYYIHNFTIKKGANYWGLIFGTSHTLGMEKFLKVCWKKDTNSGESNCNLDNDWEAGTFFHREGQSNKRQEVAAIIKKAILSGEINDNLSGLKFALRKRCLPSLFIDVVKEMEKEGIIALRCDDEKPSYAAVNIHRVKHIKIVLRAGDTK